MAIETLNYNNPATGSPVATDLVSGSYMQVMKLDGGADGISQPITGSTEFGLLTDISRIQQPINILPPPNNEIVVLPSGTRNVTNQSPDQINNYYRRLVLIINISAQAGAIKMRPNLQIKDPISSNYETIWVAGGDLTALGTYAYYFADGASGGNWQQDMSFGHPGKQWRFQMVHSNANNITYSVAAVEMH